MLLVVDNVLNGQELEWMRERYTRIRFGDGRATAGDLAAQTKRNLQLANDTREHAELTQLVHAALARCQQFMSAALPLNISPPLFNRYEINMQFGTHIDNAIRIDGPQPLRADVSATLAISSPDEYEGGELVIEDIYGEQRLRLPAGSLVIYPSSSLHHVTPITNGKRDVVVFWVQSMVRSDAQRHLLYQMDQSIQSLRTRVPDAPEIPSLVGSYHNLLRMWAEL